MKNLEEDNGKDSSQKSDIAESNEAQSTAPQKSSSEPDGGAEEAEMGNDHPSKTPSSVGEIEPVGRTTSNSVSTRTLLETAGQTLSGPEAELVLNPLRLAFETKNTKVVELALDCLHKLVEYNHLEGDPGLDGGKDAQLFADILNMVCRTVDNSSPDRGSSGNEKNKSWKRKKNDDETEMERPPQQQPSQKKSKKEIAIFGNYRNYYGYRVGSDLDEDPRLKMMKREWFEGKDCLDIGCNSGLVTISIAKKFGCHSILGVDIDGARIEDANWTLRKIIRTNTPKITSKNPRAATAELFNGSEKSTIKSPDDETGDSPPSLEKDLLKIISFEKGNFVQNWHPPPKKHYHAILCLSVSKWIHLNWGDDGVITLFSRVWALLQPGGVFVLEPQDWTSYYKNRLVSETTAANYKNIKIPPEDFQDVLLDKIGFRRVENITSGLSSGTKSGFARPILAFWK